MNNDLDTTIAHRGRLYRYDPDHDAFFPVERWRNMSPLEAWSPLIVIVALSAAAVYLEYLR